MADPQGATRTDIGVLNEGSLHATLKEHYLEPGDEVEVFLDGFVIDIRRGRELIEIQTGAFGAMGNKFDALLEDWRIRLVHPLATTTRLERPGRPGRRSPKRQSIYDLFDELVAIPTLVDHPNLTMEFVLCSVTKSQRFDEAARRGRGGFRTVDRRLDEIHGIERFESSTDLLRLVPDGLPEEFTTADLAAAAGIARGTAQKMAYCLRPLGLFVELGRTRKGYHYRLAR